MDTTEKECSLCETLYPRTPEFFYRNKNSKDGLQYICKKCTKENNKKYKRKRYTIAKRCYSHNEGIQPSKLDTFTSNISRPTNGEPTKINIQQYLYEKAQKGNK